MMEPSSSASFKRTRIPGSRNQRPSCSVDGCTADLGKCRDYHRRHKVCEVHSKTSKVTIKGQEQRFCQQCSRFHSLVEFDEGKRSCRKRLDGHNRRRRKPQPNSLSINSGLQGFGHIPFGNPRVCAATAVNSSWLGTVKAESDTSSVFEFNFDNRNGFVRGPLPQQLSFMQTNNPSLQPFLYANPSSSNGGSSSRKTFSDALNQAIDSDRAHSLLSSQPADTPEIGLELNPMVQSGATSTLIPNWQYTALAMEGEQIGSNSDLHGDELFRTRRPGSLSAISTHQTLSFSWDK